MDKNSLYNLALDLTKKIKKLIKDQNLNDSEIANIELDITLEKIRKLYDTILTIKESKKEKTSGIVVEQKKTLITEIKKEEVEEEHPKNHYSTEIANGEIIFEVETEEKDKTGLSEDEEEVQDETDPVNLFSETATINPDKIEESVIDRFSEKDQDESIADKMQKDKITDLKNAIGINEKFYFINELFNGNMKDYNEAIEHLDKSSSLEEAKQIIENQKTAGGWEEESEGLIQLMDFVERKFK